MLGRLNTYTNIHKYVYFLNDSIVFPHMIFKSGYEILPATLNIIKVLFLSSVYFVPS